MGLINQTPPQQTHLWLLARTTLLFRNLLKAKKVHHHRYWSNSRTISSRNQR